MPIDSVHPQYKKWEGRWKRCRDAYEGEEAVKAATVEYLPKLSSHTSRSDPKYQAYLMRAMFFGATNRTVEGMTGLVQRKPAIIEVPAEMEPYLDDITGTGIDIQEFIKGALDEVLAVGRYGIQVDVDPPGTDEPRAYFIGRLAEDVSNWRVSGTELTLVVFREVEMVENPDDPYEAEEKIIYRELFLGSIADEQTGQPLEGKVLQSRIWRENPQKKDEYIPEAPIIAERRTGEVDVIPFTFVGTSSTASSVSKPPLLDLVNVNMSHYRNSADLEHGRHFTGLPTPVISGIDPEDGDKILIGSEQAITIKDPAARASYLEFSGQGLQSLETALVEKQENMAVLGARILEVSKKAAETAETTRLNKSGDTSTMISIAGAVESAVTIALQQMAVWLGHDPEQVSVEINRDLLDSTMDPQMVTALLKLFQEGITSKETLYKQLQQGELLPDDFDPDEEQRLIEQAKPDLEGEPMDLTPQARRLEIVRDQTGRATGAVETAGA